MTISKACGIAGALILGVAATVISTGEESTASLPKTIYIVNNLDVPLYFKKVETIKGITLHTQPPREVDPETVGSFQVHNQGWAPLRLHVNYYIGEDGSSDILGIRYKWLDSSNKERCIHEKPDNIAQDVKHCNINAGEEKEWQYIFTFK